MPIKFSTPEILLEQIAQRAKALRLQQNLSRRTLSEKSGVKESTLKRFETTGEISFHNLLKLAYALKSMEAFETLFQKQEPLSINNLNTPERQRGRK